MGGVGIPLFPGDFEWSPLPQVPKIRRTKPAAVGWVMKVVVAFEKTWKKKKHKKTQGPCSAMKTRTCMPLSVLPEPALHRCSDRTATLFTLQGRWALGLYDSPSVPKPGGSGSLHVSSPWCLCRTCLKVTTALKQVWSRSPTPCPVLQPL